jgi:hypothetical protein
MLPAARSQLAPPVRLAAVLIGVLTLPRLVGAQQFQSWNEVDFTASWKKVDVLVPAVVRTDPVLPNPQFAAIGIVASVPFAKRLRVVGGYLFADLPQRSNHAHVPLVAVALTARKGHVTVLEQNRFEKLFDYGSQPVRYRNLLSGDARFDHDRSHVFLDDEAFFNLSSSAWNQNRFQAGVGRRLSRRLTFDIYYLRRDAATGTSPLHVLGTVLTVNLKPKPT